MERDLYSRGRSVMQVDYGRTPGGQVRMIGRLPLLRRLALSLTSASRCPSDFEQTSLPPGSSLHLPFSFSPPLYKTMKHCASVQWKSGHTGCCCSSVSYASDYLRAIFEQSGHSKYSVPLAQAQSHTNRFSCNRLLPSFHSCGRVDDGLLDCPCDR